MSQILKRKRTYTQPFINHGRYTIFQDEVIDVIMPSVSPNAWRCLCFVLRKTKGWGKESDRISYSQFLEGTGIKGRSTLATALMELRGYKKDGKNWIRDFDLPEYLLAYEAPSAEIPLTYSLNHEVEIAVPQTAKAHAAANALAALDSQFDDDDADPSD